MHETRFESGQHNAICDRCGAEFKARQLRIEWNGLRTCSVTGTRNCWEQRQPQDLVRGKKDKQTPPWVRPEPPDVDVSPGSGNEVTVGDL